MGGGLQSRCVGRVYGADGAVRRHHPHRKHDLRSCSQDHHPTKNSVQKTICCNSTSNAPDDGYIYSKHVELRILTYLLTPWCRVLLEKLTGLQLVKKFPPFHGTRRFITALTNVRHLSLSWASPIQSIYPHPNSWKSILILSTHLRLGLSSGLLPSGFPSKTLYTPLYINKIT